MAIQRRNRRNAPEADEYMDDEPITRRPADDDEDDERPARRSRRPRDEDEDEEEEETPRKRRSRDDDEDEEEAPRKKRRPRDDEDDDDDEDEETGGAASLIQSGWGAAKKVMSESSSFTNEFKFDEEAQVIKFLDTEPYVYQQHWIERKGKRSFVCIGKNCPLCKAGDSPSAKYAWPVLNFGVESSGDAPVTQLLVCGTKLARQLEKHDQSDRNGPLDKHFWALSRTGQKQSTVYVLEPIKRRDLAEDWEIDPDDADEAVDSAKVPGPEALNITSREDLIEIARELR